MSWFAPAYPPVPPLSGKFGLGEFTLRPFCREDAQAYRFHIQSLLAAPEMSAFLLTFPTKFTLAKARARIAQTTRWHRQGRGWALAVIYEGALAGQVQILGAGPNHRRAEVAYWIAPPFQRQGLAFAAMSILIDAACQHWPLEQVEATVAPGNAASVNLLNRLGFTYRELVDVPYRVQGHWRRQRAEVQLFCRPGYI